jgi:hypothetical protein
VKPPPVGGSGSTDYIPIWTSSAALGNSEIYQTGGNVGINTTTPAYILDVNGYINTSSAYNLGGRSSGGYTVLAEPGSGNLGLGPFALNTNTTGGDNTASGPSALMDNTTGSYNTASGVVVLDCNTSGSNNTASGYRALYLNTTGSSNTASGFAALFSNTTGSYNTANGVQALDSIITGSENTANGYQALYYNTASYNTASGYQALYFNTTGSGNTANGYNALTSNTTGSDNTASGYAALYNNFTGSNNTASGYEALGGNSSGANNIAIGYYSAFSVLAGNSNNIEIGSEGSSTDSGAIRMGANGTETSFFAAGVSGVTTGDNDAVPVLVDSNGQLGTVSSSRRFKEDIQDMGGASEGLMRLRPVTFRYKQPYADGSKPIQYGLIAEEVAEVYPDMVAYSADGQIETVKYQMLGPMLLNEVQHHDAQLQDQQAQIRDLQEGLDEMEAALASMSRSPAVQ